MWATISKDKQENRVGGKKKKIEQGKMYVYGIQSSVQFKLNSVQWETGVTNEQ